MTKKQIEGQLSLFDPDLCCGKMFLEHSPVTTEKTSALSWKKPRKSQNRPPLFLDLRANGPTQAASWETDGQSLGAYLTHSFGESPSIVVESRLSQILEDNAHPKYYLSAKACQGILEKAEKRRKILPESLHRTLIKQVIGQQNNLSCDNQEKTITKETNEQMICIPISKDAIRWRNDKNDFGIKNDGDPAFALLTQKSLAVSLYLYNSIKSYAVIRWLTPLECERLQGYPDGWTDIGDWTDHKGKVHKTSDNARYKALGNSIALPSWRWVLYRLSAYCGEHPTMASLFDGIGGFPLLWEQINGKGSCLWASEIEEFPIAVTKKRFQTIQRR